MAHKNKDYDEHLELGSLMNISATSSKHTVPGHPSRYWSGLTFLFFFKLGDRIGTVMSTEFDRNQNQNTFNIFVHFPIEFVITSIYE